MTLLARNSQRSHAELAEHLTPQSVTGFDLSALDRFQHYGRTAIALADAEVNRQAAMIAYLNDFALMKWLSLAAIPMVLLMRRSPRYPAETAVA